MTVQDLQPTEYNVFYKTYIDLVSKNITLIDGFYEGESHIVSFFETLPENLLNYSYAEGKWTIKEVLQHVIDTERIFMHRCFRIARHDSTALTGFDQNTYVSPSQAQQKSLEQLIAEYKAERQRSIVLLKSLSITDLTFIGNANGNAMSARSAAFSTLGHEIWHINIIKNRYMH